VGRGPLIKDWGSTARQAKSYLKRSVVLVIIRRISVARSVGGAKRTISIIGLLYVPI
jgi:hypothetical protein